MNIELLNKYKVLYEYRIIKRKAKLLNEYRITELI